MKKWILIYVCFSWLSLLTVRKSFILCRSRTLGARPRCLASNLRINVYRVIGVCLTDLESPTPTPVPVSACPLKNADQPDRLRRSFPVVTGVVSHRSLNACHPTNRFRCTATDLPMTSEEGIWSWSAFAGLYSWADIKAEARVCRRGFRTGSV